MDFLLCNTAGVLCGHWVMAALGMQQYNWLGWVGGPGGAVSASASPSGSATPSPRSGSALSLVLPQLSLPPWPPSDWLALRSPRRALAVLAMFLLAELVDLSGFFLKYVLHVEVSCPLNLHRLILWCLLSTAGLRDYYACMVHPERPLGVAAWTGLLALTLEAAVVARHGWGLPEWQGASMPVGVALAWGVVGVLGLGGLGAWFAPWRVGGAAGAAGAAAAAHKPVGGARLERSQSRKRQ